jgi:hypothetical protein
MTPQKSWKPWRSSDSCTHGENDSSTVRLLIMMDLLDEKHEDRYMHRGGDAAVDLGDLS